MQLEKYYTPAGPEERYAQFTRQQASDFAKQVAGDFNPIHDVEAKRFCVPGDLIFTILVSKLGLSERIHVDFKDMVTDGVPVCFKVLEDGHVNVEDDNGKVYLSIETSGERRRDQEQILPMAEEYVAFSGRTFPHVLVPLWKEQNVMVNPKRPLVIYQSMTIEMDTLDFDHPHLEIGECEFNVDGKRGQVILRFNFMCDGKKIGSGEKRMIQSGLREYDQKEIDNLVAFYANLKDEYFKALES